MIAYVIEVEHIAARASAISHEAYSSIEQAQAFCLSRYGNVRQETKADNFTFVDEDRVFRYIIHEVRVVSE